MMARLMGLETVAETQERSLIRSDVKNNWKAPWSSPTSFCNLLDVPRVADRYPRDKTLPM